MKFPRNPRSEEKVFAELETLAAEPGYAHAIAMLCFRDNSIGIDNEMLPDDIVKMYSDERLIRTEISTLIGLMVKNNLNLKIPSLEQLKGMLDRTDQLLLELHAAMMKLPLKRLTAFIKKGESSEDIFTHGDFLRETIFYCADSAYDFQFLEFAIKKYSGDDDWLETNKGFSIDDAVLVVRSILEIQRETLNRTLDNLFEKDPREWTLLPAYIFTLGRVIETSKLDSCKVQNILDAFSLLPKDNNSFSSVSNFNQVNACPLIQISKTEFILFQGYNLVEALYESPFYWMLQDPKYKDTASKNRGFFTERFCADRMRSVFGERRVYENVSLVRGKKTTVGEIDVLILFGNRAVVIQAKSKGLTIEARKGNDNQLRDDFKRAIQDSYEQGLSCAKLIQEKDILLIDKTNSVIQKRYPLKEIYIFCVLSEHYPALAFQAQELIKIQKTQQIMPPFVMDIFLLDTMIDMLSSPLHFLSYVNRRTVYDNKVVAGHELTVLAYHLKRNLWIEPDLDFFILDDDICADLDIAMMARHDGVPGKATPEGILTRLKNTKVGEIINQIENSDNEDLIDLGFLLLSLAEDAIDEISEYADIVVSRAAADFSNHDVTMGFDEAKTGITIHSNCDILETAIPNLVDHCEKRKYLRRAQSWFGLLLEPGTGAIRFCSEINFPWQQSLDMDLKVANMPKAQMEINRRSNIKYQRKHKRKR